MKYFILDNIVYVANNDKILYSHSIHLLNKIPDYFVMIEDEALINRYILQHIS